MEVSATTAIASGDEDIITLRDSDLNVDSDKKDEIKVTVFGIEKEKVIVKANGKDYIKEIERFRFNEYSIQDVVDEESVSGEVTIEPFSVVAQVVDEETM